MTTESLQRRSSHSLSQMFHDLRYISENESGTGLAQQQQQQQSGGVRYGLSGGYTYELPQSTAASDYYYTGGGGGGGYSSGLQMSSQFQPSMSTTTFQESSSRIADSVMTSMAPIDVKNATEMVTVKGETGVLLNRDDIINWRGQIPLADYPINEDMNPEILRKKTDQHLVYLQEVAIRYLRPPTPPPPGDIIIREEQSSIPMPAPPLVIRQQAPRPETPAPMIFREAPPKPPHSIGQKIITVSAKKLPPPPRKVIIERLPPLPSKPQSVIVERWLPYKERKRRVIFQKSMQPDVVVSSQKNIIIQWEAPSVEIKKEFKDLGVVRANPVEYVQRFGPMLKQAFEMPDFVKQIRPPSGMVLASDWEPSMLDLEGDVQALSLVDLEREGLTEYKHVYRTTGGTATTTTTSFQSNTSSSSQQKGLKTNNHLREIFLLMDVDADGVITLDEGRRALLLINERLGRNYGENDAQMLINSLDKRGDGRIDYHEFKQVCMQNFQ